MVYYSVSQIYEVQIQQVKTAPAGIHSFCVPHKIENILSFDNNAILLEIGNGLSRNYKNEAVELIKNFLASDDIEVIRITPDLFDEALSLYKKHQDKSWGLVDCVSFVVMKQNKVTQALTFDKHFVQAGFQALMR